MRILTRKQGTKKYFYLQHSLRIDGEVQTREKYLGLTIPSTFEKTKKEFLRELKLHLYAKFDSIRFHFQSEWKRLPKTVQEKEKEEISIAFTYNTNAIEGSTITLSETREIVHENTAPSKSLKDIRETETHSKVFLDMFTKQQQATKGNVLLWHKLLFQETKPDVAGQFREYRVRVGSYVAPDWQDVKKLMREFFLFVRESKTHPVELAARAHYRFEKIHPFGDGNGRVGRLITNSMLWHSGYPMIIIEYKGRKSYYKALQKDEERFVQYFFRRYLAVHGKRIK